MSVTHSAYKKTPSQRRRDSQSMHAYYIEIQNTIQSTNIRTMTDNIDIKMQHVKKIKCTSQETQTEQISENIFQLDFVPAVKVKKVTLKW